MSAWFLDSELSTCLQMNSCLDAVYIKVVYINVTICIWQTK